MKSKGRGAVETPWDCGDAVVREDGKERFKGRKGLDQGVRGGCNTGRWDEDGATVTSSNRPQTGVKKTNDEHTP